MISSMEDHLHLSRTLHNNITSSRNPKAMHMIPECNDLARLFQYLDVDGDGKISPSELRNGVVKVLITLGEELSLEDAEEVVESVDSDGDGLLEFDDFSRLVGEEEEPDEQKEMSLIRGAFQVYEMEGEGCITPRSLSRALGHLGEEKTVEECETMIRRFDIDGDGVISFDEFMAMIL